ncbi:unnamed protein product, partial [Prunus brigantina]
HFPSSLSLPSFILYSFWTLGLWAFGPEPGSLSRPTYIYKEYKAAARMKKSTRQDPSIVPPMLWHTHTTANINNAEGKRCVCRAYWRRRWRRELQHMFLNKPSFVSIRILQTVWSLKLQ